MAMRGQFYVISLVFIMIVTIGLAYFTTESKELVQQAGIKQELPGQAMIASYSSELQRSLEGGFYNGNKLFYQDMQAELHSRAAENGYNFTSTCQNTTVNSSSENLKCNLTMSSSSSLLNSSFSYTYAVPFKIRLYADSNLTDESNYFLLGDTVYYRLTTYNNSLDVNVSAYYPDGTMAYTENKTPSNFAANGSFSIGTSDPTGNWSVKIDNTLSTSTVFFYVQLVSINVGTYDINNNPQDTFERGDLVKYKVLVTPAAKVYVDVTANGQARDYGWQSPSSATEHWGNFTISQMESIGNLTVTATEQNYYQSSSTGIIVLKSPYGRYIKLTPPYIRFTNPYADAFGSSCGYTTWYSNNSTNYSGVPFSVENSTGDAVVRVDGNMQTVSTPHVYARRVHIIASGCGSC